MILLPKPKISGFWVMRKWRRGILVDERFSQNLVTDYGLNYLGDFNGLIGQNIESWAFCSLGTGDTPPVNGDTSLVNAIASTTRQSTSAFSSSPDYFGYRHRYVFGAGTFAGEELKEIGLGPQETVPGSPLWSRSLISPSITILADETLTVDFEQRNYVPQTDVTGTLDIVEASGSPKTYGYRLRAANAGTLSYWAWSGNRVASMGLRAADGNIQRPLAYGRATPGGAIPQLGLITGEPSGLAIQGTDLGEDFWPGSGNYYKTRAQQWNESLVFNDDEIHCLLITTTLGAFQLKFLVAADLPGTDNPDPVIKTNQQTFEHTFRLDWDRYP